MSASVSVWKHFVMDQVGVTTQRHQSGIPSPLPTPDPDKQAFTRFPISWQLGYHWIKYSLPNLALFIFLTILSPSFSWASLFSVEQRLMKNFVFFFCCLLSKHVTKKVKSQMFSSAILWNIYFVLIRFCWWQKYFPITAISGQLLKLFWFLNKNYFGLRIHRLFCVWTIWLLLSPQSLIYLLW